MPVEGERRRVERYGFLGTRGEASAGADHFLDGLEDRCIPSLRIVRPVCLEPQNLPEESPLRLLPCTGQVHAGRSIQPVGEISVSHMVTLSSRKRWFLWDSRSLLTAASTLDSCAVANSQISTFSRHDFLSTPLSRDHLSTRASSSSSDALRSRSTAPSMSARLSPMINSATYGLAPGISTTATSPAHEACAQGRRGRLEQDRQKEPNGNHRCNMHTAQPRQWREIRASAQSPRLAPPR